VKKEEPAKKLIEELPVKQEKKKSKSWLKEKE
jgi:hypothetical protein